MKLQVLGCHGGELPSCRTTCFLVDETLALDAGALTSTLSLEQLAKIDHVLVSHSHFDHVKDLPLLADLLVGKRTRPVVIHASTECSATLRANMFNDALWPDFTKIPEPSNPVVQFEPFVPGEEFRFGEYRVKSVPVSHPVESCGFIVEKGGSAIAISGDTGPTDELWRVLNGTRHLKALLLETSFPNSLQGLADVSGHLTPRTVATELQKFDRNGTSVLIYHLKPAYLTELRQELQALPVEVLELGDAFEF